MDTKELRFQILQRKYKVGQINNYIKDLKLKIKSLEKTKETLEGEIFNLASLPPKIQKNNMEI